MAPQATEIARNGLDNGDPACGRWEARRQALVESASLDGARSSQGNDFLGGIAKFIAQN
jgi:hypothetical protein